MGDSFNTLREKKYMEEKAKGSKERKNTFWLHTGDKNGKRVSCDRPGNEYG
jgi:hypothetical protein